jgi:hypothetical protein
MGITNANLYFAERTLRLNNSAGPQSSFSTVWNGQSITILWNNMIGDIMQIWPENYVEQEDVGTLQFIITNFLNTYNINPLTKTK